MARTLTRTRTRRINTQHLAWGVMLASFAIFCVIAVAAFVGIRYFLFQSRIPLSSSVEVARGAPTLTLVGSDLQQTVVTQRGEIASGSVLTTNTESQALLRFIDSQREGQLIASVTVESGSSVNLRQSTRPRFDWSEDAYWIDFRETYGTIDVFIPRDVGRTVLLSFGTTLGPSVRLSAAGRYSLIAAGGRVQLLNYEGEALLVAQDGRTQLVAAGQTSAIDDQSNQFSVLPLNNLLGDTTFTSENVLDFENTPDQVRSQVWLCRNNIATEGEPVGSYTLTQVDQRAALRLFRGENANSHGETECWQLGTGRGGIDLSSFSRVSIRATFKIQSQSLSLCGEDGSECPLMLSMDYVPANGGRALQWFHGFFAAIDPNRMYPPSCTSCNEQHERVTPGVWYTYESHNLFEIFAPETRPRSILNLRFYASGHQYDVYVSEVILIADNLPILELPAAEATQEN